MLCCRFEERPASDTPQCFRHAISSPGGNNPMKSVRLATFLILATILAAISSNQGLIGMARADDDPPLNLAQDGFFYVAGKPTMINGKTHVVGQMYVEMRVPQKQTHPYPIVMVHGGTRTGTTYTG